MSQQTTISGITYITDISDDTTGDVPIWNPKGLWKTWNMPEIYQGLASIGTGNLGRYVPNIGDKIFDKSKGEFIVTELNTSTLLATWTIYTPPTTVDTGVDKWLGVGPRSPQQGYYVYVDSTVSPPLLAFDSMVKIYSPSATFLRVFAASSISGNLEVLSAMYDQTGAYVDDKIPLTVLVGDVTGNYKVPDSAYSKRAITSGETVLVIAYDASGLPTSELTMTALDSGIIRQANTSYKEIRTVEIVSSYLSATDSKVLEIPVQVTVASVDVMCRVTYSDGTSRIKPIDGSKIQLSGLAEFIPTQVGQRSPLTLFYTLDTTESYQGTTTASRVITVAYTLETTSVENAYGVKLFMYPEWNSTNQGYYLRHFLYSVDRLDMWDVTDLVELSTGSVIWDPKLYGTKQAMIYAIDLSKVSASFVPYRHVQPNTITLMQTGVTDGVTPWYVNYQVGADDFGGDVECRLTYISSQVWSVNIAMGAATQAEWLDRLYTRIHPLFDTATEIEAPQPTHFILQVENIRVRKPISAWNTAFTIATGGHIGEIALIQWVREDNGVDLQLGASGAIIRQTVTV